MCENKAASKSLVTRITDAVYDRMRHQNAWHSAEEAPVKGFGALHGHKYALLTTYRKNGTAVPSPVWFGPDDADRLYISTEAAAAKVHRIVNNPQVRVAPCDARGKPLGPPAEGIARVLPTDESGHADQVIAANYGRGRKIYEGFGHVMRVPNVYLELIAK